MEECKLSLEWRAVAGYEGLYEVSNKSSIRRVARYDHRGRYWEEKILNLFKHTQGYNLCNLRKNGQQRSRRLARIVAIVFCPNPCNYPEVHHEDENKGNDYPENLKWVPKKYNCNAGTRVARIVANHDWKSVSAKLSRPIIGTCIATGEKIYYSSATAAREDGFVQQNICGCLTGKRKTARGYTWEYVLKD